jgi:Fe-Mn family superoxide dismutase
MSQMTRREAMEIILTGGLTATVIAFTQERPVMAEEAQPGSNIVLQLAPAYRGEHQIKPLPFEASKLKGLSEKLVTSHHQNNYGGAVKRLNQIQQQIGSLPKDAAPYQMGSLKREELIATNSMIPHEFYFGNLGGDGKASGTIVDLIKTHYGTYEAWEQDFRLTGMSLGGGSGWVILNYIPHENAVHHYWA